MTKNTFKNKKVLITGGSGFLGRSLSQKLLDLEVKEVRIFSRDESLQEQMKEELPSLTYILGDVRDYDSIRNAVRDVDYVVHAAAVKYLDWAQLQPTDCIKTNILGSMNVIKACVEEGVDTCIGCSTDKAPHAENVYGCSKQIMEALFFEANQYNKTRFGIVRYGNVIGSTGSVIPKWIRSVKKGEDITVTDKRMRRFFMTVDQAVGCITDLIKNTDLNYMIPFPKVINMWDLANIIADGKVQVKEGTKRPGERLFEVLTDNYTTDNANEFTTREIKDLIKNNVGF